MKTIQTALSLLLIVNTLVAQQDGDLDSGFGLNGLVENAISPGTFEPVSSFLKSDGKILIAGTYSFNYALFQINADGSPDASFGNNGLAFTQLMSYSYVTAIKATRDSEGNVLIVGYGENAATGGYEMVALRYDSLGNIDLTFGNQGYVSFPELEPGVSGSVGMAIATELDGKILIGGMSLGTNSVATLFRLNHNGSIDSTTFNYSNNHIITSGASVSDIISLSDGKILYSCGNFCGRLMANGDIDPSFGTNGICAFTTSGLLLDQLKSNGASSIYAFGELTDTSAFSTMAVARINADGAIDNSFGLNGLATAVFEQSSSTGQLITQPDGKVIAIGALSYGDMAGDPHKFALARLTANGSLDISFGSSGTVTTDFPTGNAFATTGLLKPDGKILAVGESFSPASKIALAQYYAYSTAGVPISMHDASVSVIYPNPARASFSVKSAVKEPLQIRVYNTLGELVFIQNIRAEETIDCSTWASGIYWVHCTDKYSTTTRKLIID